MTVVLKNCKRSMEVIPWKKLFYSILWLAYFILSIIIEISAAVVVVLLVVVVQLVVLVVVVIIIVLRKKGTSDWMMRTGDITGECWEKNRSDTENKDIR